jgi:hypothetical protein
MGGFLGIGGSSSTTDRGNQLAATQGDWNLYNYGLPAGQTGQATGQGTLNTSLSTLQPSQSYFDNLLTAGRTQTAQNAAPAINATLAGADATRTAEANMGTGRGGGTAPLNRNASTATNANVDNIINTNMVGGQATGAAGLDQIASEQAGIGSTELGNALSLLGISSSSVQGILSNSTQSKQNDPNVGLSIGSAIGSLFMNAILGGG